MFTKHLSADQRRVEERPRHRQVGQLARSGVGGKGNAGVTALIKQTPGAIGYVEYGYAKQTQMPMAALENKSGKYVKADPASEQAALAGVELPADLRAWIPDPGGARRVSDRHLHLAALLQEVRRRRRSATTLKAVIRYGLSDGQKFSDELGYIPLPAERRRPR